MSDIGVGVLGWGLAGEWFHGAFISAVPGLEIVSVATRREVDAARFPRAKVVRDAQAVFEDPAVELVVIATPNRLHVEQAHAALAAGKHVVVDKPIARTAEEARGLVKAATKAQRVLTPYQNRRFDGDFRTVQEILRDGRLGDLHFFRSRWPTYRPSPKQRSAWKAEPDPVNGLLYDLGPHLVDQALVLFGRPDCVKAQVEVNRAGGAVPDLFRIQLGYSDGPCVVLEVDQLDPFEPARFELRGAKGAYIKHGVDAQEASLRAGASPGEGPWGEEPPEAYGRLVTPEGEVRVPTRAGDYRDFYSGVRDAIRGVGPAPVDPRDTIDQLEIIVAALASSSAGREVEI